MTDTPRMRRLVGSLLVAFLFAGCGTSRTSSTGGLTLRLELANGAEIDEVDYSIAGNDMESMAGTIDTSAPGSTASVEVYGLPGGEDFEVTMTAVSTDGETSCAGAAMFDVVAGATTQVMVILNCKRSPQFGGVRVNGKFNLCAELTKEIVSPLQTSIGNSIDVLAEAVDAESDAIAYQWTATGGSFSDPTAPQTAYACEQVGEQTITVAVSDDDFDNCDQRWSVVLSCVDASGGGGTGGTAGGGGTGGEGGTSGAGGEGGSWTPPPGTALINFSADDTANMTYDASDGLAWKGSFNFDAVTRELSYDPAWGGPFAVLYDDGPWSEGGHEPAGATAADGVWGITAWMTRPTTSITLAYGAIRGSIGGSDGEWIWIGPTGAVQIDPDSEQVTADGLTIPAFGTIDIRWEIDLAGIDPTFADWTTLSTVAVKTNILGFREVAMVDDGSAGDQAALDNIYTMVLSQNLGKHEGLRELGDEVEFIFVLDDVEYRVSGQASATGATVSSDADNPGSGDCLSTMGCPAELVTSSPSQNLQITVGP